MSFLLSQHLARLSFFLFVIRCDADIILWEVITIQTIEVGMSVWFLCIFYCHSILIHYLFMAMMKLFLVILFSLVGRYIHTNSWRLIMQTSNFNRKRKRERKNAKRCIRANTACERRGWRRRRKLSKEVCQVLPSPAFVCERTSYLLLFYSFLFVRTYINARRAGILGNEIERKRESKDIQSSSVTTTWCGFSFSHHQRRRTEHKREGERRWQW
jgi:hypothetical protein